MKGSRTISVSLKFFAAAVGVLILIASVIWLPLGRDQKGETYRVGVLASLTGPGESYGTVTSQAIQMAADEINMVGGIGGVPLELIVEDSKCNAQDAIVGYRKLTQVDGVKIILGTSCSGAMLGITSLAERDQVILFSGVATNPTIRHAGDYIFRTSMSDLKMGIGVGNLLVKDGYTTLATINESTDYAEVAKEAVTAQFLRLGGKVVGEERYSNDEIDFRAQIAKLITFDPQAIYVAAQSEFSGGTVIKQLRELGYKGALYANVVSYGTTALDIAGDAATGLRSVTATITEDNEVAQSVLTSFRARYGYVTLPWHLSSVYDDVYITAECLSLVKNDQDTSAFKDCLYEQVYTGAIGKNYSFDSDGEVVGVPYQVIQILSTNERTEDNFGYLSVEQANVEE